MQEFTLTAEQRIYYYMEALNCFRDRFEGPYICNVLKWLLIGDGFLINEFEESCYTVRKHFPEFKKQIDSFGNGMGVSSWYSDDQGNLQREQALKAAIAEAEATMINSRSSPADSTT